MNRTSISDLKLEAKDQLLGNYGIATGSLALLFVLLYSLMTIVTTAVTGVGVSGQNPNPIIDQSTITGQLAMNVLSAVLAAISAVLSTGYTYVIRRIADGEKAAVSDLFYVFRHHPDKVVIVSLIMTGIQILLLLPATFAGNGGFVTGDAASLDLAGFDGKKFLIWLLLYLAGFIASFIIDMYLAMTFQIYLDDNDETVTNIISRSISLMKGNVLRYFYLLLSFVGYYLLILLSIGIAALWVIPYQTMAIVKFYYSIRDEVHEC